MKQLLSIPALFGLLATSLFMSSCNQDDNNDLDVPSTYSFTRNGSSTVDHSGQTERLDMLALLSTYMKSSNTVGATALDADLMKDMFANENAPFGGQTFAKDLKSKCFQSDVAMFEGFMDDLATASAASGTASDGTAGVLVDGSSDPTSGYRVNANGVELTQIIEKGLMGAVFYYQAMEVYLSADRMGTTGNSDLSEGENYTDMEHYFDEAFGYFGVPTDFPSATSLDDARFWGKYCNSRNNGLYDGLNKEIATAFRTARAAIVAKDYDARDAAIQTIQQKWSLIAAASAIDYLRKGKASSGEPNYKRHHTLSEAIGFLMALKYHFEGGNSKFPPHYTYMHIQQALTIINTQTNIYTLTDTQIDEAIGHLQMAFPTGEIQ
ncbi:MAG: DUF4856 domain-containing protein [Flavobacteriales bacterium]|nr:DUF4856 domain-containing protein [Flavobacteriales bacterium]